MIAVDITDLVFCIFIALGVWGIVAAGKALLRFFNTIPVAPSARAPRQEYGEECPTIADAIQQKALSDRLALKESTAWERAHNLEVWELFCAKEDEKRRATNDKA